MAWYLIKLNVGSTALSGTSRGSVPFIAAPGGGGVSGDGAVSAGSLVNGSIFGDHFFDPHG